MLKAPRIVGLAAVRAELLASNVCHRRICTLLCVRLLQISVSDSPGGGYWIQFPAGPFTVLFGKNNAGKTCILEGVYLGFEQSDERLVRRRFTGSISLENIQFEICHLYVELEQGIKFDDAVYTTVGKTALPPTRQVVFNKQGGYPGGPLESDEIERSLEEHKFTGPRPHVLLLDWEAKDLYERVEDAIGGLATYLDSDPRFPPDLLRLNPELANPNPDWPWISPIKMHRKTVVETAQGTERLHLERGAELWRVNPTVEALLERLTALATDLLPDFIEGSIHAQLTSPGEWGSSPKVVIYFGDDPDDDKVPVHAAGHATARWAAAAVQIALDLMAEYLDIVSLRDLGVKGCSGRVLLLDEPEAHLHPGAVQSVVRWCQRMVEHGFTVVAASHHEEFLRAPADEVTLVHVKRAGVKYNFYSAARTLDAPTVTELQRLAADVGMHPANMLALHRAILFVEGPLDEAFLDEYGGLKLDAAGVKIIPIHGTRNLEGLVSAELATQLGIKIGILTDSTVPTTIPQRSRRKWSSEERKVTRLIEIFEEKGLPSPKIFGVPEADLLFVLPVDAIREFLQGPFPPWKELVAECRDALGKGPSDSVDWKSYALENYGLQITTAGGVRDIVRALDLNNVPLPSAATVIDEVVGWAK